MKLHEQHELSTVQEVVSGGYNRTVAGNELNPAIGICVPDCTGVYGGIPLKVTLVGGAYEVDIVVMVGALGCGSIFVRETTGATEVDMTTSVVVECALMGEVAIIGSGTG